MTIFSTDFLPECGGRPPHRAKVKSKETLLAEPWTGISLSGKSVFFFVLLGC